MRLGIAAALACLPCGGMAATFAQCTKAEIAAAGAALADAGALADAAAKAVADTPAHARWFGRWDSARADDVRATFGAIAAVLRSDGLRVVCPEVGADGCPPATFAWVMPDGAEINLCPAFFDMPGVAGVVEGGVAFETGTREGTIIHEASHFVAAGATSDHCYGRTDCAVMARRDPGLAVANADSYQYFAEDVAIGSRD